MDFVYNYVLGHLKVVVVNTYLGNQHDIYQYV